MMNPVLKTTAFAVIGMAYSLCLNAAGTWYVDAAKYGQAGMDGSSAKPYGTIQEAVNAAKNGDVIKVAPGLYNQGVQSTNENSITTLSRVQIVGKALTLEATGAKSETIIEGARAATDSGLGADAVRCILFMGARTTNSVVRGFTLRGGRTLSATEAKSDSILNSGGAVMGHWDSTYSTFKNLATLIDCDVLDCGATRGGALRCVNAIRCRFLRCFATNNGAVSRNGSFFNCLFAHSYGSSTSMAALDYFAVALNCTFVDNDVRAVKGYKSNNAGKTYNCYVGFCGGDGGAFTHEAPKDAESLPYVFNSVVHTNYVSSTYLPLTTNCVLTIDQLQLASPATGDYHPLAEADETMRIASVDDYNANFPARFADEANKDLEGQPRIDAQGWLRVGALETPVTPASGFVFLADKEDGRSEEIVVNAITSRVVVTKTATCTYLTTPTWPATVEVTFTPAAATAETYDLFGVEYRNSSFSSFKFPRLGESRVVVMPPPQAVRNTYLYPNYGERRYVATTGTDATTDDQGLSAAKPWKTLQYAADNAPSNAVIHVAAGDYDEGFNVQSGDVTNRLYIANRIRFVADEGPAATRILGAPDPSVTDPDAVGCGAGAIRCVCAKKGTHSCVQGFTLENGHTQSNSSGSDGSGGGYLAGYKIHDTYLVDSVVTNCSGSRGAVYGGVVSRCLIVGNKIEKKGNGVTRGAALVSSIVRANDSVSRTGNFADVGQDVVAINSTVDTSVNGYSLNHLIDIVNSIVDGGDIPNDGVLRTCAGTLFSPNTTYYPALDGRYGDPCFLDKIGGDYRLYACSPAVQGTATNDYTIVNAWRYVSGDYEGRPFTFNASGTPIAGALQATAPGRALYVAADGPGAAGATVVPSGVTVLADDTPVTVTTAGSSRPCVGLEINGVFQPGLTATTIDPTTLGPNEGVRVRVLFSTDWYVDAVKGNDANTGWATNAAMKTLVGVMAKAAQGDTVHALPGVYNEGSAVHDGAYLDATSKGWGEAPIPARVVVQTNVTLAAMGTADETVIEGALGTQRSTRATGSTYETYALGTNAVRCVFLNEGSVVQGFTLRNGRVNASSQQDDNNWGAGVLGRGYDTATVVDCVVSNCASWRGAAGYQATFRRCHVVENKTPGNSCAGRKCAYYGCYIARNQDMIGQWGGLVASVYDFIGNTVAADNYNNSTTAADKAKGVRTVTSQESPTTSRFWNNVILQSYDATYAQDKGFLQATLKNAYQNFFASESSFPTPTSGANNEFGYASAALKIGADGVPACDSPVVDVGDFAYVATNLVGEADLNGVPRGRNGNRPDVGAFEQPWLARYAKDIGGRRLTVTDASCAVFENASQKVEIPSGHLALAWQPLANGSGDAVVALEVTGNGTLTVYKDGVVVASYAAGTHAWQFAAVGGTMYALDFVYEPGENDTGAAIVHLAKLNVGFVLMMR